MILVSKIQFQEMFALGILKGNNKSEKEWTVTSRAKPGKRKKHYVHEADYNTYLNMKNGISGNKDNVEPRDYSKPVEIVKMKLF